MAIFIATLLTIPCSPSVDAAPSGATSTLEIAGGAAALYYTNEAITTNVKSKGARKEAESVFADTEHLFPKGLRLVDETFNSKTIDTIDHYNSAVAEAKKKPSLSLKELRGYIIDAVMDNPDMIVSMLPHTAPDPHSALAHRSDFEALRTCWNDYTSAPAPLPTGSSSNTTNGAAGNPSGAAPPPAHDAAHQHSHHLVQTVSYLESSVIFSQTSPAPIPTQIATPPAALTPKNTTCVQPLATEAFAPIIQGLRLDIFDTDVAFTNAPSLEQQVANQQIGGNNVENFERQTVLSLLAIAFLDDFPENPTLPDQPVKKVELVDDIGNPIFPPQKKPLERSSVELSAQVDVPSGIITLATSCLIGGTTSGCISQLSSIESQAVSGIASSDACALSRDTWIPPFSRIMRPQTKGPVYGQPPGCT